MCAATVGSKYTGERMVSLSSHTCTTCARSRVRATLPAPEFAMHLLSDGRLQMLCVPRAMREAERGSWWGTARARILTPAHPHTLSPSYPRTLALSHPHTYSRCCHVCSTLQVQLPLAIAQTQAQLVAAADPLLPALHRCTANLEACARLVVDGAHMSFSRALGPAVQVSRCVPR